MNHPAEHEPEMSHVLLPDYACTPGQVGILSIAETCARLFDCQCQCQLVVRVAASDLAHASDCQVRWSVSDTDIAMLCGLSVATHANAGRPLSVKQDLCVTSVSLSLCKYLKKGRFHLSRVEAAVIDAAFLIPYE